MSKSLRRLSLVLVLALVLGLLSGCETTSDKAAKLAGTWYCRNDDTTQNAEDLLQYLDFAPEEIALADLEGLDEYQLFHFGEGMTYHRGYDTQGLKTCVRQYLDDTFNALYNGRSGLGHLYAVSFDDMDREEFRQFYAELYTMRGYMELLDRMTDIAYDYESLTITETGTYRIMGSKLLLTPDGEDTLQTLPYELQENGALLLQFSDGDLVFTR